MRTTQTGTQVSLVHSLLTKSVRGTLGKEIWGAQPARQHWPDLRFGRPFKKCLKSYTFGVLTFYIWYCTDTIQYTSNKNVHDKHIGAEPNQTCKPCKKKAGSGEIRKQSYVHMHSRTTRLIVIYYLLIFFYNYLLQVIKNTSNSVLYSHIVLKPPFNN